MALGPSFVIPQRPAFLTATSVAPTPFPSDHLAMKVLLLLGISTFALTALADDLSDLLAEAQRTYIRGESAAAKEKFELILRLDPQNRLAIQYLKRIIGEEMQGLAARGPANATEKALKGITMPQVKFSDASLSEVLEYLRQKGNAAGQGKLALNFVMQMDEAAKARKVTLALQNVPLTEVLRYLGQLAEVDFVYEPFAIVVKPKVKGAAPGTADTTAKPQGS